MKARVGVILSGCGFRDGSEVFEATSALIALDQAGAEVFCYAPNVEFDAVDYLSGEPTGEKRNVLAESARIVRGDIEDIKLASAAALDGLVIPGGFGAAKNLCNFAEKGPDCEADPDVVKLVQDMHAAGKPIGAICIAPALVAKILGDKGPTLTIGNDKGTADALESMGAKHADCVVTEAIADSANKIVSTPAYMLAQGPGDVAKGVAQMVETLLSMIEAQQP